MPRGWVRPLGRVCVVVLLYPASNVLSDYTAYAPVFGPIVDEESIQQFLTAEPVLLVVKLGTFLVLGVYRGLWRYVGMDSLVLFAKAVCAGSVASTGVLLLAFRFAGFSRAVFVLDGLILLMLLVGSRLSFRLFRGLLPSRVLGEARRVLIYGAGDGGILVAWELLNNRALQYIPIGFADDDPRKKGKVIRGLRVLGGNGSFLSICQQYKVDEVLIAGTRFTPERIGEIVRDCQAASVSVRRMRLRIEHLGGGGLCEPEAR